MERIEKMKKHLQQYFDMRMEIKREYLLDKEVLLVLNFETVLKELVFALELEQKKKEKQTLYALFVCHLMSSDYTGSHEIVLGLCGEQIYLDELQRSVYWRPPYFFDSITEDMKDVKKYLQKDFMRIEEYELFRLRLKLLQDDWKLVEEMIPGLVRKNQKLIVNSSLYPETEVLILSGVYMEPLEVIGRIKTGKM